MTRAQARSHKSVSQVSLLATGTQTTNAYPLLGRRLSVRLSWTGTPTGVFSLQTSFDGGVTFVTVPGAAAEFTNNGQAQPAGGASSGLYNWQDVPGSEFRISYAATSGTGTLSMWWEQGL